MFVLALLLFMALPILFVAGVSRVMAAVAR